jgi:hypothetical protein
LPNAAKKHVRHLAFLFRRLLSLCRRSVYSRHLTLIRSPCFALRTKITRFSILVMPSPRRFSSRMSTSYSFPTSPGLGMKLDLSSLRNPPPLKLNPLSFFDLIFKLRKTRRVDDFVYSTVSVPNLPTLSWISPLKLVT